MKFTAPHGFTHPLLIGLLATIGFGGSVGVGTVWMRHQVSVLADTNRDLEQQYREVERRLDDVRAQVESELSPDVLRARNQSMHLGLVELTEVPIDTVPFDPIPRLVAKANRRVLEREAVTNGMAIQFNLPGSSLAPTATSAPRPVPAATAVHPVAGKPANFVQFATNP